MAEKILKCFLVQVNQLETLEEVRINNIVLFASSFYITNKVSDESARSSVQSIQEQPLSSLVSRWVWQFWQHTTLLLYPYLIFVIFFTQTKILDRKFYTEECVNYGKRISRQNSVNCDLLAQANYTNYTLCVKLHTECKSWVPFV